MSTLQSDGEGPEGGKGGDLRGHVWLGDFSSNPQNLPVLCLFLTPNVCVKCRLPGGLGGGETKPGSGLWSIQAKSKGTAPRSAKWDEACSLALEGRKLEKLCAEPGPEQEPRRRWPP